MYMSREASDMVIMRQSVEIPKKEKKKEKTHNKREQILLTETTTTSRSGCFDLNTLNVDDYR
jgi:hypothetical protein